MCAITLPCPTKLPIGIMLCMNKGNDEKLINLAEDLLFAIKNALFYIIQQKPAKIYRLLFAIEYKFLIFSIQH